MDLNILYVECGSTLLSKGRSKKDSSGCASSGKGKKEYKVSGNRNLPSERFWSKSKKCGYRLWLLNDAAR